MKTLKIFTILAILLAALFVVGGSASARSLAASGVTFINGVFASGSGSAPLASTHYQMQAVVGEAVGMRATSPSTGSVNHIDAESLGGPAVIPAASVIAGGG